MLLAWISLTLSRHSSLSFIASGRSSGLHPVSSQSRIVTSVIMRTGGVVTVNESQMEILAERGQDFVWRGQQRNKKTYLKFDAGENRENVEY